MQSTGITLLVGLRSSQAAQDLGLHFGGLGFRADGLRFRVHARGPSYTWWRIFGVRVPVFMFYLGTHV